MKTFQIHKSPTIVMLLGGPHIVTIPKLGAVLLFLEMTPTDSIL